MAESINCYGKQSPDQPRADNGCWSTGAAEHATSKTAHAASSAIVDSHVINTAANDASARALDMASRGRHADAAIAHERAASAHMHRAMTTSSEAMARLHIGASQAHHDAAMAHSNPVGRF